MPTLERLGLLQRISDKPMKIRAVPVEEGFSILIKNWIDETSKKEMELSGRRNEFLRHFRAYQKSAVTKTEETHYALLLERDKVINRLVTMLRNAEKEVVTVTSPQEIVDVLPVLASASQRAVRDLKLRIRVILDEPTIEKLLLKNVENYFPGLRLEIRCGGRSLSHYLIADYRTVLMATSPQPSIGKLPYLWTDTVDFAEMLQKNFEELWNACAKLDAKQRQA